MKKTKMLKKNYEFSNVLKQGTYFSGRTIEAFILNNKSELNFLGLAISRKGTRAYERNRVKRLIRENYRLIEERIKSGYSIVFLWKKKADIKNANFYQIKEDMLKMLEHANIIGM